MVLPDAMSQARRLKKAPYTVEILPSQLMDGTVVYLAYDPQFKYAKARGDTVEQATRLLRTMRADGIDVLAAKGSRLPRPRPLNRISA